MRSRHHIIATEARKGEKYSTFLRASVATYFKSIAGIPLLSLLVACGNPENDYSAVPEHILQLPDVTIVDTTSAAYDLLLEKNLTLHQTDFDFIQSLWDVYSDRSGRFYWSDHSIVKIHQFDKEGNFLGSIGNRGRGPGELENIRSSSVHNNHLFLLEYASQDVHIYEVETRQHVKTVNIKLDTSDSDFPPRFDKIFSDSDDSFYAILRNSLRDPDEQLTLYKFQITNEDGQELLKYPDRDMIVHTRNDGSSKTFADFMSKSEVVPLSDGRFLQAHAGSGLITVYDNLGEYERAIYIDFKPGTLSETDINYVVENSNPMLASRVENADVLPDVWPVWHRLFSDPFDNIWVEMNINPPHRRELWVISPEGRFLARTSSEDLGWIRYIDDHYLYSTQNEGGIHSVERYRIRFEK